MKALSVISKSNNPDFNLATEEYLLKYKSENFNLFYINSPSVIIGKHQNALAEINLSYIERMNIPLYRRLSGGGTVYHDYGNINYCFIKNGETGDMVNFKKATQPIADILTSWGVSVRSGERNDLLINYNKISGNACHVYKSRVMHHGTLLYDSDIDILTESLKNEPLRYNDKAVKSVRSNVTNIKELLKKDWSSDEFLENIELSLRQSDKDISVYELNEEDISHIEKLRSEKYNTWEWNYGYSPSYLYKKRIQIENYIFNVEMQVEKGVIKEFKIRSQYPDHVLEEQLIKIIEGSYHEKRTILNKLSEITLRENFNLKSEDLIKLFF